jgi:hypothetical protein
MLAEFWLSPVGLAGSVGFGAHELTGIRELVEANQVAFLEAWHEYFGR